MPKDDEKKSSWIPILAALITVIGTIVVAIIASNNNLNIAVIPLTIQASGATETIRASTSQEQATPHLTPTALPTQEDTIQPSNTPATAKSAIIGGNSDVLQVGSSQIFIYEGQTGEILTVKVFAERPANTAGPSDIRDGKLLDTVLIVRKPDRSVLDENDDIEKGKRTDSSLEDLNLPESGSYQIEVRSHDNKSGGAYTLLLQSSKTVTGGIPDLLITDVEGKAKTCLFTQNYLPRIASNGNNVLASWVNIPVANPSSQDMPHKTETYSLELANAGTGNSQPFSVTALAISKSDFDTGFAQSATIDITQLKQIYTSAYENELPQLVEVSELRPGETTSTDVDVVFWGSGDFVIVVIADMENKISEMQENNTREYSVFVDGGC